MFFASHFAQRTGGGMRRTGGGVARRSLAAAVVDGHQAAIAVVHQLCGFESVFPIHPPLIFDLTLSRTFAFEFHFRSPAGA
jgi:hypothetical protein